MTDFKKFDNASLTYELIIRLFDQIKDSQNKLENTIRTMSDILNIMANDSNLSVDDLDKLKISLKEYHKIHKDEIIEILKNIKDSQTNSEKSLFKILVIFGILMTLIGLFLPLISSLIK